MKKAVICVCILLAAVLCAILLISGTDSYYFSEKHSEKSENISILSGISSYDELLSALTDMISSFSRSESLTVTNYSGNLMTDLEIATDYLTGEYPLGSYAVSSIVYNPTFIASYCELQVVINYSRTADEINGVMQIMTREELEENIREMIMSHRLRRSFLIDRIGISGDEDIRRLFEKCWIQSGVYAYGLKDVFFTSYPRGAQQYILEISLERTVSEMEMIEIADLTEKNVQAIIADFDYSGTRGIADCIAEYLYKNTKYDKDATRVITDTEGRQPRTAVYTAAGAINDKNASQSGIALAASVLLSHLDVEHSVINGTHKGASHTWIYMKIDGEGYHFDPTALFISGRNAKYLFTEKEAKSRFSWDDELYGTK